MNEESESGDVAEDEDEDDRNQGEELQCFVPLIFIWLQNILLILM